MQFIVTADPDFTSAALDELRAFDPSLRREALLAPGIALVAVEQPERALANAVSAEPPIFVRHIMPVHAVVPVANDQADVERLVEAVRAARQLDRLAPEQPFSVQARFVSARGPLPDRPYTPYALKEAIVPVVARLTGAHEDVKAPEMVISLVLDDEHAYLGISSSRQNLSSWAGGMRRFAREAGQISRAEFKLLEALDVFELELPRRGRALDLGAAPGGWTRLLLAAGLEVTAVDPARMDERLGDHPRLRYVPGRAQEFLADLLRKGGKGRTARPVYQVIFSDMRMDVRDAAGLMVGVADLLDPDGFGLVTLKLPYPAPGIAPLDRLDEALNRLAERYTEVQARQLFHNRHEVTALLRNPE